MVMDLRDLQKLLDRASEAIPEKVPRIIEVEGLKQIKKNFRTQGYNDGGVRKWQKRKTTDKDDNDLTRYRTSRRGSRGSLTKFGQREQGRAILVGHDTGGDKLINSYRARKSRRQVVFYTYKKYAARHNEGKDGMPKRQHVGRSKDLDESIGKKLTTEIDKIMRA